MTRLVLDTSVILAVLLDEPGKENAARLVGGGIMSSVTLTEIVAKCIERSVPEELALDYVRYSNIEIVSFDAETATLAGRLWSKAPKGVLSLGDRACIATAIRHNATAVTADRIWSKLSLACPVELIR